MKIIKPLQPVLKNNNSIYLAGPTYRVKEGVTSPDSWRKEAMNILQDIGFDGLVYVPEWPDEKKPEGWTYSRQVSWELEAMTAAGVILFWVVRGENLPGMTTNIEFGEWINSGKFVAGSPPNTLATRYMEERCSRIKVSWVNSLHDCINNAVNYLKLKGGQLSRVFFTADTHFGNVRTLELSKRPFSTTDEMDFLIISNWNKVITNNDIVYHLGDFGNTDLIKFLKGKQIFILPGNYDTQPVLDQLKKDNRVYILPTVSSVTYQDTETLGLVHEPTLATNKKLFWLFGHIHGLQTVKLNGLNVGVDCHHFKPLDLDTVLFYKNGIQNHYDDNVFISTLELK